jgi:hypothetical protein
VGALKPAAVAAPTAYTTYTAIDKTFSCDQPAGWKRHETGAEQGVLSTATFEQGHVRFWVISDAIGSMSGDMITASNNAASQFAVPGQPPPKPAVERLHEADQKQLARDLPDYHEGDMQPLNSPVGDARLSEWTAAGGFGAGRLHGYRATLLGREREITVICIAPERNWAALKPAFDRMIASVAPGNG